ncbi:MAG: C4-type zinc ribbon domain-containing protein [Coriobacteriia bacterium]|nr:C4-type zinc ribbon domain-containing protein [Coriobacteriia bacterium]
MGLPAILLALQECDLETRRASKELEEMPEKKAILKARHKAAEVRELRGRAEELARRLERSIAANNDEVASVEQKIAAVQATLDSGQVTNPKEVHNLSREMDALKRREDKLDNDTLTLMERAEKAGEQLATIDAALETLADRESELITAYQHKGGEVQTRLEEQRAARSELAAALGGDMLARYEAAADAKGGIGAARLLEVACSACRVELPAERLEELKAGPDIGVCPNCRRLLVVRGTDDGV